MDVRLVLLLVLAVIAGFSAGWLVYAFRANHLRTQLAASIAQLAETRNLLSKTQSDLEESRGELSTEQHLRVKAETERTAQLANLEEQRRLLSEAETKLRDTFHSLAGRALEQNNQQFLQLAEERLRSLREEASGDLAKRQESIKGLVDPLQLRLTDLQSLLTSLESSRESAYGDLRAQVQTLAQASKDLQKETGTLVNTLRQPQVKGRWGELTLRRAVELAGMSPHCDFLEQASVDTPEGRLRPDLVVHLPGNARVVVDSKVPLHGFLRVVAAQTEPERDAGLLEHARLVRTHVSQLSSKEYWKQFAPSPDFVILFVPGESFYSAALEKDPTLFEDAISSHVVLASPANLIAILRAIAFGWKQEKVAESAHEISQLGRELHDRLVKFTEHLQDIRSALDRANQSFNNAVGSFEGRLLPAARKLKEKGIQSGSELPILGPAETALRSISPASTEGEK